ncbi:MAG: multidrug effflux MFS transporter [Imperialibacter sp.]|uniref:multidrug effflux MFS transporter n=1 Tax=Imperialibacter sp. TaxID=2038411 RepID=UPI0032EE1083
MTNHRPKSKFSLIFILGLLTAIGPFSVDMYLPAFSGIAKGLNTSVDQVMLSLSSFFVGISAGQLLYGPLLERFGRKNPLYFGLSLYLVASVGCAMANSVEVLIAGRFFQALGGCVGMVAARAMVRDLFEVKENAKIFSSLMLVVAVSPIIAPTAGGLITSVFGWRYVFVALVVVAIGVLVGIYWLLPESKKPDPSFSLMPRPILRNFASVFRYAQFTTFAFTGAVAAAGLYAYVSGSPHVYMEVFQLTEGQFSWVFAVIAMGLIGSTQLNNLMLKKYSSEQIIGVGLSFQATAGVGLVAFSLLGLADFYSVTALVFVFLCCQGFIFPNSSALSMAPFHTNAGNASALMGAVQMAIGAGASVLVSVFHDPTPLPMAGVMACCALSSLSIFHLGRSIIKHKAAATLKEVEQEEVDMIGTL